MGDVGPSNWYNNPMEANNTDPERSDQSDDYMDVDSVPQFIPNPNDLKVTLWIWQTHFIYWHC